MTVADGEGNAVFEVQSDLAGPDLDLAADGDVVGRAETTLREAPARVQPALE
ncbi:MULTISPECIES: hypothetical protein [Streptomyces]|uniref:hypothetical protein n=1 Tax=Streptomyces TaxID=1883 RepID=UPI00131DA46A|nr:MULTISPECIES: hypothetical protein [Streptomyces]